MKKINSILLVAIIVYSFFFAPFSWAATNPNYGTTTFFSDKAEKPSDNPPMYDVGLRSGNKDKNNNGGKINGDSGANGSLFNQIITGVGSFFGNSSTSSNGSRGSLFDLQGNSNQDSGDSSGDLEAEFIMGSRGESFENLNADDAANYNNRIANKFNFNSDGAQPVVKKSKLLFTNVTIPVDMTTQYVIIISMILIAIGSVTGYYFWKKEMDRVGRKSKK